MMLRRLLIGTCVMFGLSVWAWSRPDGGHTQARAADPVYAGGQGDQAGDGNHDDAVARFRSGQSRHWRHVMIGTR